MNRINRSVVKEQAKMIIRGKIFYLFLITIIVSLLAGTGCGYGLNDNSKEYELFRDNNNSTDNYDDYSSDYYSYADGNPIESFGQSAQSSAPAVTPLSAVTEPVTSKINPFATAISGIVCIIFAPLTVTLAGMYLALVRRRPDEPFAFGNELGGIFKNSFDDTYLKKLVLVLLQGLIMVLLFCLFLVPGVIFYYSSFFAQQILSDNPNLKPSEAILLSRKMVKGNRGELFVLDLSFMGWFLLCAVTCGIVSIYVLPYYMTVKALYYENFRMRALQQGRITADDFLSFEEKMNRYSSEATYNNGYNYANADNNGGYYYSPQSSSQQADNSQAENQAYQQSGYCEPQQQAEYYTPPQDNLNSDN